MAKSGSSTPMGHSLTKLWRSLASDLFGVYRPELHYMRGPGPKWREKHAPQPEPAVASLHQQEAVI